MITATDGDQGLVDDGEIYAVARIQRQWSACTCTNGQHALPIWWQDRRAAARHDQKLHGGHVIRRVTATTRTEIDA